MSGGEEGALLGPSIMPGGDPAAYAEVEEIFTSIAAVVDDTPCCVHVGPGGAGHYVKMVHNGIEYADIQLIAEAYDLLTHVAGLDAPAIAKIFEEWNSGDLDSFLIEITAKVLAKTDEKTGGPLVDVIVDQAEQKGTGTWTAVDALGLGIPLTGITEAVFARGLSALRDERKKASTTLAGPAPGQGADRDDLVEDIRLALYASKVVAYAQGFAQMRAASEANDWDLDLGAMATIWRGGCIIRARFLNRIRDAYAEHGDVENLLMVPYFTDAVANAQDAWRRVVTVATEQGVAIPAFSSSLSYYDGYRRERGPANLIQGLRDFFGAHTYQRTDAEGYWHTRWSQDGTEVAAGGQPRSEASGSTSLPRARRAAVPSPTPGRRRSSGPPPQEDLQPSRAAGRKVTSRTQPVHCAPPAPTKRGHCDDRGTPAGRRPRRPADRPADRQHHPHAGDGRGAGGELGAPGHTDGAGPGGLRALDAVPALRPRAAGVGQPRPVRALRRARLHAALRIAAPVRGQVGQPGLRDRGDTCRRARRPQAVPPARLQVPRAPEYRWTSGVECTTGPLGTGIATSVGMAIAGVWQAATFNRPGYDLFDYDVYAIAGDGCLMEGIGAEAASLAAT